MAILITGAAGFIGSSCAQQLLARGEHIVGIDNLNDYYDPALKHARLAHFTHHPNFTFREMDIGDRTAMEQLAVDFPDIDKIIHLAAQAGVRHSLKDPYAYVHSNILGQLNILEFCRNRASMKHLVYASSSSVYGGNKKMPFSTDDNVDHPVSLYAASKKANELMGHCYSHLFDFPQTGLRFFTVYGPWGRPDMALFIFTRKILNGEAIPVFNHGNMRRDFTYIDDIVSGVIKVLDNPPRQGEDPDNPAAHRVFNIGNNRPENLMDMIATLENALGQKAKIDFQPMQPGDVPATYADVTPMREAFGYEPSTNISEGIPAFVEWYRDFYKI